MLNKKVCKKCWVREEKSFGWNRFKDREWRENNVVVCPFEKDALTANHAAMTNEEPPEWCPYAAEHIVSGE